MKPNLYLRIVIHSGIYIAIYRLNPNQDATDAAHDITILIYTPGFVIQRIIHKKRRDRHRPRHPRPYTFSGITLIHVCVAPRTDASLDAHGFVTHSRRHTKHYFVGGFHKNVSAERLKSFVTNRGLKVTLLRVLPSYTV